MNRINSDLMVHLSFDDFQILHACNMKYFDRIMMQFYLQGLNLIHLVMVYNNSLGVSKVCICRFFRSSLKIKENWLGYNFVFAFYFQSVIQNLVYLSSILQSHRQAWGHIFCPCKDSIAVSVFAVILVE